MTSAFVRRLHPIAIALGVLGAPALALAGGDASMPVRYALAAWSTEQSGDVLAVTQDLDGYLWLATNDGPVRFDGTRFQQWAKITGNALLARPAVALASSAQGGVWVGF